MRKRKAKRGIPTADYYRPETLTMCLRERVAVDPDGLIDVYLLDEDGFGVPRRVGAMSVAEACMLDDCDISDALREYFGGGYFRLRVSDSSGRVLTSYSMGIYGPEGGSRWSPEEDSEPDAMEERLRRIHELIMAFIDRNI